MGRTVYRETAVVDHDRGELRTDTTIVVDGGRIAWIGPTDAEPDPGPDAEVVDCAGSTAVAGMVDAHSHLTMPGGAHWIDRGFEPVEVLEAVAEDNARLLSRTGVRWARDVGAPARHDPAHGRDRALSLTLRDRWRHRHDVPYIRAAGCWVNRRGALPEGLGLDVDDGDGLLAAAVQQLDDGADLVKLYLDGPDRDTSPFTAHEVARVVAAAHERGARVTAHSGLLPGARQGVEGGVDSLEHGFQLDADVAALMAAKGVALVTTLAVLESWRTFGRTTTLPRFAGLEGRAAIAGRREWAHESARLAHRAGVLLAAGTDFGGGSLRAGQLAWEVETMVAAGIPPADALAAATRNGGILLGEPEAGVLHEGGPADFFLVHGDPTTEPSALWRVWRTAW
ncbi:MAG TPA: amidohydrolase family protein [Acidimicrobiales bacterium]|jgi:imidazolonepropionase-like amidohydrolase